MMILLMRRNKIFEKIHLGMLRCVVNWRMASRKGLRWCRVEQMSNDCKTEVRGSDATKLLDQWQQ